MNPDRYYFGNQEISLASPVEKQKLTQRLRQYLELRHVSLLIGNGCSIPLGSPILADTKGTRSELAIAPFKLDNDNEQKAALDLLDVLLPENSPPVNLEYFLGALSNFDSTANILPSGTTFDVNNTELTTSDVRSLTTLLKKWLYLRCRNISDPALDQLRDHRALVRRLLLRSTTLPRAKLFTTNYDLILEHALDSLGIMYLDGFTGTIKRTLQTQSYHYDLYYPGETTEGHVSRVDRVLHLYKLHGSINWRRSAAESIDVVIDHVNPANETQYTDMMIYPSPLKSSEMHGYPYSEMFRHFSTHINQAQSVLFAIGYAFQDDHINRLIYQALNVPSFTLVIVVPEFASPSAGSRAGREHEIWRLINVVNSNRIIVITGGSKSDGKYKNGVGTLHDFATSVMPDISELDISARVAEEALRAAGQAPAEADGFPPTGLEDKSGD